MFCRFTRDLPFLVKKIQTDVPKDNNTILEASDGVSIFQRSQKHHLELPKWSQIFWEVHLTSCNIRSSNLCIDLCPGASGLYLLRRTSTRSSYITTTLHQAAQRRSSPTTIALIPHPTHSFFLLTVLFYHHHTHPLPWTAATQIPGKKSIE